MKKKIMIVLLGSLLSFNTIQANESLIEEPTPDTLVEIPDYETPTGFPVSEDANMADDNVGYGNLVINKQLITHIWHTECDVMGNQAWVPDIDNPTGDRSREGHRLDHCGQPGNWIIYLDENGVPYMLEEKNAGGANGGILIARFYSDGTYTQEIGIDDINLNERIYFTTENDYQGRHQVWHHSGIAYPENPTFKFYIGNGVYELHSGETLTLENLPAGTYQIVEEYNPEFYPSSVSVGFELDEYSNVVATVTVNPDQTTEVDFVNERITERPEPTPTPTPTPPVESEPESIPESIPESVPESVPESIPESVPESIPETPPSDIINNTNINNDIDITNTNINNDVNITNTNINNDTDITNTNINNDTDITNINNDNDTNITNINNDNDTNITNTEINNNVNITDIDTNTDLDFTDINTNTNIDIDKSQTTYTDTTTITTDNSTTTNKISNKTVDNHSSSRSSSNITNNSSNSNHNSSSSVYSPSNSSVYSSSTTTITTNNYQKPNTQAIITPSNQSYKNTSTTTTPTYNTTTPKETVTNDGKYQVEPVKTGDEAPIVAFIIICILSLGVILYMVFGNKKEI